MSCPWAAIPLSRWYSSPRCRATSAASPAWIAAGGGAPPSHHHAEDIVRGYRTEDDCIYLLKEKLEQLAQSLAGLSAHRTPMEDIEHDSE